MQRLCTYFDIHYLARGLALHASLLEHWPDFELWVLCLDDASVRLLRRLALPRVRLVTLADLQRHEPALAAVRGTRSRLGYFLTCTPLLIHYVLDHAPDAATVLYLDADLFFSHPAPVLDELAGGSILIHDHSAAMQGHAHGTFNVGLVGFRRDEQGLACLDLWRQRCIAWCDSGEGPDGQFGDQQYLDEWPGRFSRVVIARSRGIGCAPWNLDERPITVDRGGHVRAEGEALVFFHFHRVRSLGPRTLGRAFAAVDTGVTAITPTIRRALYLPYVQAVLDAESVAHRFGAPEVDAFARGLRLGGDDGASRGERLVQRARGLRDFVSGTLRGRVILVVGDRAV